VNGAERTGLTPARSCAAASLNVADSRSHARRPSLGLAPKVVDAVFDAIARLHAQGRTMLLVEQNAYLSLEVADRAYVLETGRVVLEGRAAELLGHPHVRRAYLGR